MGKIEQAENELQAAFERVRELERSLSPLLALVGYSGPDIEKTKNAQAARLAADSLHAEIDREKGDFGGIRQAQQRIDKLTNERDQLARRVSEFESQAARLPLADLLELEEHSLRTLAILRELKRPPGTEHYETHALACAQWSKARQAEIKSLPGLRARLAEY